MTWHEYNKQGREAFLAILKLAVITFFKFCLEISPLIVAVLLLQWLTYYFEG